MKKTYFVTVEEVEKNTGANNISPQMPISVIVTLTIYLIVLAFGVGIINQKAILVSSFVSFFASLAFGPFSKICSATKTSKMISWLSAFTAGFILAAIFSWKNVFESFKPLNNENIGNTLALAAIGMTLAYDLVKCYGRTSHCAAV